MKSYKCVALIPGFVLYVVGCSADAPPEEKSESASAAIITGAGSPAPGAVCTTNEDIDPSCNTPAQFWAQWAFNNCNAQGRALAGVSFDGPCPNGAVVKVQYACCGPQ